MWINGAFPNLGPGEDFPTSPATDDYNCIAWAAGDQSTWWSHFPGYYWPTTNRNQTVESLISVFSDMGYVIEGDSSVEVGYEKIAIYGKAGLWKHAARQLPDGKWASKLGPDEDIEHLSPEGLCGDLYGDVYCIMRRRKQ